MTDVRRRRRAPQHRREPQELADMALTGYPGGLTHRKLEALADSLATGNGWLVHALHDSRGESWSANSGWPDRFYVRGNWALALEFKVPPDTPTDKQRAWLEALDAVPGITALVFTSSGLYTRDLVALGGAAAMTDRPYLTPRQVAARLQLNPETVRLMLVRGQLPGTKLGRQWRTHPDDLDEWLRCSSEQAGRGDRQPLPAGGRQVGGPGQHWAADGAPLPKAHPRHPARGTRRAPRAARRARPGPEPEADGAFHLPRAVGPRRA
ncbi:MAG TPA: helix-turn-helix domain-containing protein [candidate division Zixibacteria bacterium]|nr:helix-turn-helix domain-containing protein [candidate division Zixibacteria bacterium]